MINDIENTKTFVRSIMDHFPNQGQRDSIELYLLYGLPLGSFFEAVFSNQLVEAFGKADYINKNLISEICSWLYNSCPTAARGSTDKYLEWVKRGCLVGHTKD